MKDAIREYIGERYDRWLDYSQYQCSLAGMKNEANDVLNEVICMLLEKSKDFLEKLLNHNNGKYNDIDFFVLKMIRLNVQSDTAPYRHKYKPIPTDDRVDWRRMNIADEDYEDNDSSEYILERMNEVRDIVERMNLSQKAKDIFMWRFFSGESFECWTGKESKKELYDTFNKVLAGVKDEICGKMLF